MFETAAHGGLTFAGVLAILFVGAISLLPFYKIFAKAGYPGFFAIGLFVPLLNLILIFFFAFSDWPVLKELRYYRDRSDRP